MSLILDPESNISRHFTWKEALWFPRWNRLADENDGLNEDSLDALRDLFIRMDWVRDFIDAKINVHVAFRSPEYNRLVGGALHSAHIARMIKEGAYGTPVAAVDWSSFPDCDQIRKRITPKLSEWGLRMENKPGSNWIHLDTKPVPIGGCRIFNP